MAGRTFDFSADTQTFEVVVIGFRQRVLHFSAGILNSFIDKSRVISLSLTIMKKTKAQIEYELEDARQSLEIALEELNHWKKILEPIGQTPERVYEFWRKNQIKMFKYQREAIVWKHKAKKAR